MDYELLETVMDWVRACDAFTQFEQENPNDSTKKWGAVFVAKCEAEWRLRVRALEMASRFE